MVIAHRGAWKKHNFPENSIASLKEAIRLKCAGSEFDVRMTADDSLIINHDPTYNNLTIENTLYKDLSAFKLPNGENLPTLREYIYAGTRKNKTTKLICEIKSSDICKEKGKLIAEKTVGLVQELKAENALIYISFDYDILLNILKINPKAETQYLEGDKTPDELKADGISGCDYHISVYQEHPEWIESAKKNILSLNTWTVNEITDMDWFISNKFDFITTNEPELLFERLLMSGLHKHK